MEMHNIIMNETKVKLTGHCFQKWYFVAKNEHFNYEKKFLIINANYRECLWHTIHNLMGCEMRKNADEDLIKSLPHIWERIGVLIEELVKTNE